MTEDLEKLRKTIDQLHEELAGMQQVDEQVEGLLQGAVADIHATLEKGEAGTDPAVHAEPSSIVTRLSQAARHYDESHPTLSGIIGSIIDTLSRMGI